MQQSVAQPQYEITEADKKQKQQILQAWQAYKGDFPKQIEETPEGIDPNANSNRMEPIVFIGVNFLFGKPVGITASEGSPQEAQTFLDNTWGRTEARMPLLQDLATSGATSGQAFLRIVPNRDMSKFLLRVVDPMTVFVQTAPKDCKTVLLYCIEYSVSQSIAGSNNPQQIFYREEIQRVDPDGNASQGLPDDDDTWLIQSWSRVGDSGNWTPTENPISWPYNFAPIFSCQNRSEPHDFWGVPDITPDLIQTNEDINLTQSDVQLTQIIYGHPILYATDTGEGTMDVATRRITNLPSSDSKIAAVQFSTDTANALAFLNRMDDNISEQSAIPGALARQSEAPRVNSGIQMELMYQGVLAKTEMKRCRYGELIIDVSKALLVLGNFSEDIDVSLTWKNPLPHDDLQSAQAIAALQAAGVSIQTSLEMFGFDADAEEEKRNNEDAKKAVAFSRGQGLLPSPPNQQQPGQDDQQMQGGQQ